MTRGLENAIERYMYGTESNRYRVSPKDDNEDQFSMFFAVDVSNPERIECPIFMIRHLIKTLHNATRHDQHINKIVVPAYIVKNTQETYKTIDSLFKYMFESSALTFAKKNFKDNIVYGNRGVIVDAAYQLIYCETLLLNYSNFRVLEENIYIHPDVYKNSKNIINKGITNKFMPRYIGQKRNVDFGLDSLGFSGGDGISSNIIFKELPILQKKRTFMPSQNNAKEILQKQIQTFQNSMQYAL